MTCDQARLLLTQPPASDAPAEEAAALRDHLGHCPGCQHEAETFLWQDRLLAEQAAQIRLPALMAGIHAAIVRQRRPATRPRVLRLAALALAAGLLLALGLFLTGTVQTPPVPASLARLEQVEGIVYILAEAGRIPAQVGAALVPGQGVETVGPESTAVLAFADGTQVSLEEDTQIRDVADTAGKSVVLTQGQLTLDVPPQSSGQSMTVTTPQARTEFQGTQLAIGVAEEKTRLDVEKGRARMTRHGDGRAVEVTTGRYAIAAPGVELTATLLPTFAAQAQAVPPHVTPDELQLWLRADTGVTENQGSVSDWADQSGHKVHARQRQANLGPRRIAQALHGRPALRFDGERSYLSLPAGFNNFTDGLTAFVVARPAGSRARGALLLLAAGKQGEDSAANRICIHPDHHGRRDRLHYTVKAGKRMVGSVVLRGGMLADRPQSLAVLHRPSGEVALFRNGIEAAGGSAGLPTNVLRTHNLIGRDRDRHFAGDVYEILLYNRALSENERLGVESYLFEKYFAPGPPRDI